MHIFFPFKCKKEAQWWCIQVFFGIVDNKLCRRENNHTNMSFIVSECRGKFLLLAYFTATELQLKLNKEKNVPVVTQVISVILSVFQKPKICLKTDDFWTNKARRALTQSQEACSWLAEGKYAWDENKTEPNHTHGAAFNSTLYRTPLWLSWSLQCMWHVGPSSAGPDMESSGSLLLRTCPSAQLESPLWLRMSLSKYSTGTHSCVCFHIAVASCQVCSWAPAYCHCSWLPGYVSLCLGLFWWRISTEAEEQQQKKTLQKALFPCCIFKSQS